ncbi:MAG: putative rane protein [Actinomycetota bacterium]|nr:putative rane protein [Actinomycetota bacterium]
MAHVMTRLRGWFDVQDPGRPGNTPDYRFSLANERTFLAWIRTSLALIGGGLAVAAFLPANWPEWLRHLLSAALILLGAAVAIRAVDHWSRAENAMRLGESLPVSRFPAGLAIVLAAGSVALAVVVFTFV